MAARRSTLTAKLKFFGFGLVLTVIPGINSALAQQGSADDTPSYWGNPAPINNVIPDPSRSTPIIKPVHKFALDLNGNLQGKLTDLAETEGLQVFLLENQSVSAMTPIDDRGRFTLRKVRPGTYSLIIAGNGRIAARGISIVESATDTARRPSIIKVSTVETRYEGLKNLINQSLDQSIAQAVNTINDDPSFSTNLNDEPESKRVRIINGALRGQISSLIAADHAETVQIYLIRDSQPVYQVQTNALGSFLIPDVEPGAYDFVAVGKTGFAALRFQAIGSSATTLISFQDNIDSLLEVSLAENNVAAKSVVESQVDQPQSSVTSEVAMEPAFANPNSGPIEYASESIACGCGSGAAGGYYGNCSNFVSPGMVAGRFGGQFGGGFHGGLGGSGRFGGVLRSGSGLGRLLSLGVLGGTIVALTNDNDPGPASPVTN